MPLSIFLWALFVLPIWQLCIRIPVAFGGKANVVYTLLAGYVLGTAVVMLLDRRYGPPVPKRRYSVPSPGWLFSALLAGMGFAILGSEIGNIGNDLAQMPIAIEDPRRGDAPPWLVVILSSLVHPICFMMVVVGIAGRSILAIQRPWPAIIVTAFIGSIGAPMHLMPQLALVTGLPAWLFARTRSILLTWFAYLPMGLLPLLELLGLSPGIEGFDAFEGDVRAFQPLWFNLLGAVLVVVGLFPILASLEEPSSE